MIFQYHTNQVHGPALPMKCPMCRAADYFVLHSHRVDYRFLALLPIPGGGTRHWLACPHCKYEIEVASDEDVERAKQLVEQTDRLFLGGLSQEDFARFVHDNPLACAQIIDVVNRSRDCPHCGADVPGTFDRCWNCDAELEPGEGEPEQAPLEAGSDESTPSSFGGIRI